TRPRPPSGAAPEGRTAAWPWPTATNGTAWPRNCAAWTRTRSTRRPSPGSARSSTCRTQAPWEPRSRASGARPRGHRYRRHDGDVASSAVGREGRGRKGATMNTEIVREDDQDGVIAAAAGRFTALVDRAIAERGRARVVLTGGGAGIGLLAALRTADIDWPHIE